MGRRVEGILSILTRNIFFSVHNSTSHLKGLLYIFIILIDEGEPPDTINKISQMALLLVYDSYSESIDLLLSL